MSEVQNFVLWVVQTVPQVLLQPPFAAFTGIAVLSWTVCLVSRILRLGR